MPRVVTFNSSPLVELHEEFLTPNECLNIINYPIDFRQSQGWDAKSDAPHYTEARTSASAYRFNFSDQLKEKVSKYFNVDIRTVEDLQIQRYEAGQEFKRHFDYFHTGKHLDNNRVATMIIYLNDNFTGGNTDFPRLNQSFKPVTGAGLYFRYDYDDPEVNLLTEHAGSPIKYGVKYIVTAWFRKNPYR